MSNVRVCVDVVGGDERPQVVLDGIEAALEADSEIEILAVGPAEIVNPFAAAHARVETLEAPDVISMDQYSELVLFLRSSSCRILHAWKYSHFLPAPEPQRW